MLWKAENVGGRALNLLTLCACTNTHKTVAGALGLLANVINFVGVGVDLFQNFAYRQIAIGNRD